MDASIIPLGDPHGELDVLVPAAGVDGERGHQVAVRLPPDQVRQADLVIASRMTADKTLSDVIRSALLHYFRHLRKVTPGLKCVTSHLEAAVEIGREQRRYQLCFEQIPSMVEQVLESVGDNQLQVEHVLRTILEALDAVPDEYWRRESYNRVLDMAGPFLKPATLRAWSHRGRFSSGRAKNNGNTSAK